jgi:uncharacterized protein (DUF1778 family)
MASKKRIAQKNIDRITTKEDGYVVTSLRLTAAENKLLRAASAEVGISFNGWAIQTLTAAAKKIVKKDKN